MRREPRTKTVHPKKDELKRLGNEVNAAKLVVSNLKSEAISIKKEFVGYGDERKNLLKKIDDTKTLLKNEEFLLVEKKKEVDVVNLEISKKHSMLKDLNFTIGVADNDLAEKVEYLKQQTDHIKEKLTNEEQLYGKKIRKLVDELEELSEKKNTLFDQYDSLGTQTSVREIELTMLGKKIEEKKVELEKIEVQIQGAIDSLEKTSKLSWQVDDEVKEKLSKLGLVKEELSELKENVKKGEKKLYDRKEQIASLVQKEVALEKREAKVKAIYKKVGIDKKI